MRMTSHSSGDLHCAKGSHEFYLAEENVLRVTNQHCQLSEKMPNNLFNSTSPATVPTTHMCKMQVTGQASAQTRWGGTRHGNIREGHDTGIDTGTTTYNLLQPLSNTQKETTVRRAHVPRRFFNRVTKLFKENRNCHNASYLRWVER
jgi:hypothetical protein